jgi:putative CocE/NonD family hydrolase
MNKLHTEWYDWTLKGGKKPEFLKKRVACYVAGAEEWRYADRIEDLANAVLRLHLNSTASGANDVFHSGSLQEPPPTSSQPDHYIYDPLDVRLAELEKEEVTRIFTDERYELNLFDNGLIYHSAPFEKETEVTGWIKLSVWMQLDVPDTDFQAGVFEILPNGEHILLTQDQLRARYRESLLVEKLVPEGEIIRFDFTGFLFFSRRLAKGSRLRLLLNCPNSIYNQKNYNSGGIVASETAADARVAHVTVYHDAEHPSFLELNVNKPVSQ